MSWQIFGSPLYPNSPFKCNSLKLKPLAGYQSLASNVVVLFKNKDLQQSNIARTRESTHIQLRSLDRKERCNLANERKITKKAAGLRELNQFESETNTELDLA